MKLMRAFQKVALGVITAGSTILIAACYGTSDYFADPVLLNGKAMAQEVGVPGIEVCIETMTPETVGEPLTLCETTAQGGDVQIIGDTAFVDEAVTYGVRVCFTDVDGSEHGSYKPTSQEIQAPSFPLTLMGDLEPAQK